MYLRRKILTELKGEPMLQKALAFALFLKSRIGRNSVVHNYSVKKLRSITGLSPLAIKKYVLILEEYGWIHYEGKDKAHLVIGRLASEKNKRNISLDIFCMKTFKDAIKTVRALIVILLQSRKDYMQRILLSAENPRKSDDYREIRRKVRSLVRSGHLNGRYERYKEYGLSFKRIAKEIGVSVGTAFKTVKYAVSKNWLKVKKNVEQVYAHCVNFRNIQGYTFSTKNNLYIVHANCYELSKSVLLSFSSAGSY